MRILSIDWDYFFPCDEGYDWGHQESPFFIDTLWNFRVGNKTHDGKLILDVHTPTAPENFWPKILTNKPRLIVAESHCEIWNTLDMLRVFGPIEVVNLDAHHDCGYKKYPRKTPDTFSLDCGDWAFWGLRTHRISAFHQHYPAWRKARPEGRPAARPTSVSFELPAADSYNAAFICRSGAWTPPWYDDQLTGLIKASRLKTSRVLAPRGLTLQQAREQAKVNETMMRRLSNPEAVIAALEEPTGVTA